MSVEQPMLKSGNLPVTLSTWVFLLSRRGLAPLHEGAASALAALSAAAEAPDDADWSALGQALVDALADALGEGTEDEVVGLARALYGDGHIATDPGGDREQRLAAARAYQFKAGLPWLARIYDRFPDGSVGPHWILVEQITDVVTCMDPYPWDTLDEEYQAPVVDFMVKWELAGNTTIRWVP